MLYPLARHFICCLVLVQPRKGRSVEKNKDSPIIPPELLHSYIFYVILYALTQTDVRKIALKTWKTCDLGPDQDQFWA